MNKKKKENKSKSYEVILLESTNNIVCEYIKHLTELGKKSPVPKNYRISDLDGLIRQVLRVLRR